jgi:WD40 repeat protein
MACKFLEISSGQNLLPTRFEITEVELNIYMLKTQDSNAGLLRTLDKWLKRNYSVKEPGYIDMLWERSSSMRQVLSEGVASELNEDQMGITGSIVGVNEIHDESV